MIYVVQRWQHYAGLPQYPGVWITVNCPDGMPLRFTSQAKGWNAILVLQIENKGGKFRLIKVRE